MPAFRFRLAKILNLKERLKSMKRLELARIESELEDKERALIFWNTKVKNLEVENVGMGKDINEYYNQFEIAIANINRLKTEIQDLEVKKDRVLNELIEMEKEVKILDKLREKKKGEFIKELLRREMKFMDEIAQRSRRYE